MTNDGKFELKAEMASLRKAGFLPLVNFDIGALETKIVQQIAREAKQHLR